jgi:peptide/nickel transport system ATP-binding protein
MRDGRIVESGSAQDVFDTPLDPYTRALLASLPTAVPETVSGGSL